MCVDTLICTYLRHYPHELVHSDRGLQSDHSMGGQMVQSLKETLNFKVEEQRLDSVFKVIW